MVVDVALVDIRVTGQQPPHNYLPNDSPGTIPTSDKCHKDYFHP